MLKLREIADRMDTAAYYSHGEGADALRLHAPEWAACRFNSAEFFMIESFQFCLFWEGY